MKSSMIHTMLHALAQGISGPEINVLDMPTYSPFTGNGISAPRFGKRSRIARSQRWWSQLKDHEQHDYFVSNGARGHRGYLYDGPARRRKKILSYVPRGVSR